MEGEAAEADHKDKRDKKPDDGLAAPAPCGARRPQCGNEEGRIAQRIERLRQEARSQTFAIGIDRRKPVHQIL